jgi:hypothetical protein
MIGRLLNIRIIRDQRPGTRSHLSTVSAEKNIAARFAVEEFKNAGSAFACGRWPIKKPADEDVSVV